MADNIKIYLKSLFNSYSQVFFSDNKTFAAILIIVSFADLYAGLLGLLAVIVTNLTGFIMGFDRQTVAKGLFGFNSLLVGLGLGIYYAPGPVLILIIILSSILTLFISVSLQGVIGKYGLPYLSVPFIIGAWLVTLAAREFELLGISERGIYTVNEMYTLGGSKMVALYEWWNNIEIARAIRIYFISLGAILFQYNILAGIILSIGLLYHSRISFTLSLLGFFTAYLFYEFTGASITDLNYSYIGFNYILTSIAIGGFFIIPSWKSYLWTIILVPIVAILTISMTSVFRVFALPIFALPFNIVVLLFLYVLKFRVKPSLDLAEVVVQQNSPEKNLYSYVNDIGRFQPNTLRTNLPFYGKWEVSQAHNGKITHKGDWKHAWDFIITDDNGIQFKSEGNELADYYCYNKPVTAVADGTVESVVDNIPDNPVGEINTKENWGNTVIIKHADFVYSSLSHLMHGSISVKEGQRVRRGEKIGLCGNSGRSPYPHLHFQMQYSPYIGSKTLNYPIGYYLLSENNSFKLKNYAYPEEGQKLMNVETTDLLKEAFNLVPGRQFNYVIDYNDVQWDEKWEVFTDEFNNSYIRSSRGSSVAYFENDGNMLLFRHYEGSKDSFLYWYYLSLYRVQLGFYDNVELEDYYPANLFFRKRILFFQDFLAPFFKILRSKFSLEYKSIDSEISPSLIVLESRSVNRIGGFITREVRSDIEITETGVSKLSIAGNNIKIKAECKG